MKRIALLTTHHALIAAIGNTRHLFGKVNDFLTRSGKPQLFDIQLVSEKETLQLNKGSYTIKADATLEEVDHADLIIIPPMSGAPEEWVTANKSYIKWMEKQYKKGAEIASLCVGAYLLAETGLLKHRECSTHWQTSNDFRERFPDVVLVDEKIITDHDGLYTSGGANSYWNLLIYLVEKFTSREIAIYASKYFEIDPDRVNQSVFRIFEGSKLHEDRAIREAQQYIETHYQEKYTIAQLAKSVNLGQRTFQRRFKEATHFTVATYIQKIRIEAAKRLLEGRHVSVNDVMYDAGYHDPKAFRAIFKKETGLSPVSYRNKYS